MDEEVKNCPFCGKVPSAWIDKIEDKIFIQCRNQDCGIKPRIQALKGRRGIYKTLSLWNTRHEASQENI